MFGFENGGSSSAVPLSVQKENWDRDFAAHQIRLAEIQKVITLADEKMARVQSDLAWKNAEHQGALNRIREEQAIVENEIKQHTDSMRAALSVLDAQIINRKETLAALTGTQDNRSAALDVREQALKNEETAANAKDKELSGREEALATAEAVLQQAQADQRAKFEAETDYLDGQKKSLDGLANQVALDRIDLQKRLQAALDAETAAAAAAAEAKAVVTQADAVKAQLSDAEAKLAQSKVLVADLDAREKMLSDDAAQINTMRIALSNREAALSAREYTVQQAEKAVTAK